MKVPGYNKTLYFYRNFCDIATFSEKIATKVRPCNIEPVLVESLRTKNGGCHFSLKI